MIGGIIQIHHRRAFLFAAVNNQIHLITLQRIIAGHGAFRRGVFFFIGFRKIFQMVQHIVLHPLQIIHHLGQAFIFLFHILNQVAGGKQCHLAIELFDFNIVFPPLPGHFRYQKFHLILEVINFLFQLDFFFFRQGVEFIFTQYLIFKHGGEHKTGRGLAKVHALFAGFFRVFFYKAGLLFTEDFFNLLNLFLIFACLKGGVNGFAQILNQVFHVLLELFAPAGRQL